jgi:peptidyl-prolyl cis-trans isomerase A (cyclophilin A)
MQAAKIYIILVILSLVGCNESAVQVTNEKAPQQFTARFETTKGEFDIKVSKQWSPKAADRLYNLIKSGYYNNTTFYRVVPNFVAQFGSVDTIYTNAWKKVKVPDEKVLLSNKKGTITFARLGRESRGFDLFINLRDNTYLDTINFEGVKGYPAFGTVTNGMDVVEKLYSGYGETTLQYEKLYTNQKRLLGAYPKLDIIKEAYITSEK